MLSEQVIQDFGHEITVLYYNNVHKGYKFIGDDPENRIIKVPSDVLERVYNKLEMTGHEDHMPARAYLDKFYLHNRCLLFTSGVWMSETAGVPHILMYKPGTYLNYKMAGMTRLTALTDNASCICVGPDPDGESLGYYNREVLKVDDDILYEHTKRILVATQDMWYDGDIIKAGKPYLVKRKGKLKLLHSGYVVSFWLDDVNIEDTITDYISMWIDNRIVLKERNAKNQA